MYACFLKHGIVKLIPKRTLCEHLTDWRPITLKPVIYKLISKMLVHRLHNILHDGLHPHQYGFVPRRQIYDNIANALIAIEYAKYTKQDVLIL